MKELKDYPCPICGGKPIQRVISSKVTETFCSQDGCKSAFIRGETIEESLQNWIEYCERIKNAED